MPVPRLSARELHQNVLDDSDKLYDQAFASGEKLRNDALVSTRILAQRIP